MNTEIGQNNSQKGRLFGFISLIAVLIIFTWSAKQVVILFPSAINSLASLADTVYNYNTDKEFRVMTDKTNLKNGETLTIWWNKEAKSGYFTFTYKCEDGLALDLKTKEKDFSSIACDQAYDLGLADHVDLKIDSEKKPFVETEFNIAYFKKNQTTATTNASKTISVTNTEIAKTDDTKNDTNKTPATSTKPTSPKPTTPKPAETEITYTYEIPVSKPNGFTDLLLNNLFIGTKNKAGMFVKTNSITKNKEGAIQFVVHNIGTKTSEAWTFSAKLPGDVDFTSSTQVPLKPNERATISLSFPAIKDTDLQKIKVEIKTDRDKNKNNNILEQTVVVVQ